MFSSWSLSCPVFSLLNGEQRARGPGQPCLSCGSLCLGSQWALEGLLCVTWVIALAGGWGEQGDHEARRYLRGAGLCSPVHRPLLDLFLVRSSRQEKAHDIFNLVVALRNLSEKESIEAGGSH